MKYKKQGFTLLELLIVMVIIGLLAALVAPKFTSRIGESNVKTTKAQIELLSSALESYRLDTGDYPSSSQGLAVLIKEPAGMPRWKGPYLKKIKLPTDAWGRDFIYKGPDSADVRSKKLDFIISSLGKDGRQGGEDEDADLHSYE